MNGKKRKFDGPLQKEGAREPIKDPVIFNMLVVTCQTLFIKAAQDIEKLKNSTGVKEEIEENSKEIQTILDNYEQILKYTDELIEMEPLRGVPWMFRAQALANLGRLNEALECCERSIEIDPSDPNKWQIKSMIYTYLGNKVEAVAASKRAKELI